MPRQDSLPHEEFIKSAILGCKEKYIGLAVHGHNRALWFRADKVEVNDSNVIATGGWGSEGACSHLHAPLSEITAVIQSDRQQYLDSRIACHRPTHASTGTPIVVAIHHWLRKLLERKP